MTEPEPLLSVRLCFFGVGLGCCARNAEGGTPEIGATTCICHRCQEEKELREAEDSTARWGHLLESLELGLLDRATARWGAVYLALLDIKGMAQTTFRHACE